MMMLSCKDMGATDCDFTAKGENAYDVKMKAMDHMKSDHKDMAMKMDKMSDDEKKEQYKKMMMNMKCA